MKFICNHARQFGVCSDCSHDRPHEKVPMKRLSDRFSCQNAGPCQLDGTVVGCHCEPIGDKAKR